MDDNPEIRDRLNVNKSTYHNKRPRERFICFIRGAKWTKINHLNGPSPIHDTSSWLSQSIQSIRHVCCRLGMQKNLPWKCFRTAFGHYDFPTTSASQQAWRMRKRYHLLLSKWVEGGGSWKDHESGRAVFSFLAASPLVRANFSWLRRSCARLDKTAMLRRLHLCPILWTCVLWHNVICKPIRSCDLWW